jgi:hypothetical protein
MSHTPHKWELDDELQICAGGYVILQATRHARDADAILAAAAPDLLEALEAILKAVEGVPVGPESQARSAIKKAKGQ